MGSNNGYNWQDFQVSSPSNAFHTVPTNPQFEKEASDIKDGPQLSPWAPNVASTELAEAVDRNVNGGHYFDHPDYPQSWSPQVPSGNKETSNASPLGTSEESAPFPPAATEAEVTRQQRNENNEWADRSWKMFVINEGHRIGTSEMKKRGHVKWDEITKSIWLELGKSLFCGNEGAAGQTLPWEAASLHFYVRNGALSSGGSCKYSGNAPARFVEAEVIISFCQVGRLSRRETVEGVEWMSARSTTAAAAGGATRKRTKNEVDYL